MNVSRRSRRFQVVVCLAAATLPWALSRLAKMKTTLLAISIALVVAGCSPSSQAPQPAAGANNFVAPSGAMLKKFGKLVSVDGTLTVKARRRSVSIVDYTVTNTDSSIVLANGGGFSDAQRWFLFFDSNNQLWVYNSDIGGFGYWERRDDSKMEFVDINGDTPISEVPTPVIENMPNSIKRHFGWD